MELLDGETLKRRIGDKPMPFDELLEVAIHVADARDQAAQLRRAARAGKDPLAERQRDRHPVPTFKKAAQEVHSADAKTFRNAKHRAQWLASLEQYAFPFIGDRMVDAIEAADVLKVLAPM